MEFIELEPNTSDAAVGHSYDVFFSYARVDNHKQGEGIASGWVHRLCHRLLERVDQKLGRAGATRYFLDSKDIGGNDDLVKRIYPAVDSAETFVAFLSPGYFSSRWCLAEIARFLERVGDDTHRRLFLVLVDDVSDDVLERFAHEEIVQRIGLLKKERHTGFKFFKALEQGNDTRPLDDVLHKDEFDKSLYTLRSALANRLLEKRTPRAAPAAAVTMFVGPVEGALVDSRQGLIDYCRGLDVVVVEDPAAIGQAHVVVQLLDDPTSSNATVARAHENGIAVLRGAGYSTGEESRTYSDPDILQLTPAEFHLTAVEEARQAAELRRAIEEGRGDGECWAMVKFSEEDANRTHEVVTRLEELGVTYVASRNGLMVSQVLEHHPLRALIVVLGPNCSSEWLRARGKELIALNSNLKDRAPRTAYYYPAQIDQVPPFGHRAIVHIRGPEALDRFVAELME